MHAQPQPSSAAIRHPAPRVNSPTAVWPRCLLASTAPLGRSGMRRRAITLSAPVLGAVVCWILQFGLRKGRASMGERCLSCVALVPCCSSDVGRRLQTHLCTWEDCVGNHSHSISSLHPWPCLSNTPPPSWLPPLQVRDCQLPASEQGSAQREHHAGWGWTPAAHRLWVHPGHLARSGTRGMDGLRELEGSKVLDRWPASIVGQAAMKPPLTRQPARLTRWQPGV